MNFHDPMPDFSDGALTYLKAKRCKCDYFDFVEGLPMSGRDNTKTDWSHFPHAGDVGIRGYGATPAEAFENAARAMTAVVAPLDIIRSVETVGVTCWTPDPEILLVDWLNAVIFEMATRRMLFCDFSVNIDNDELRGEMRGEAVDRERHEPSVELKGATLTELKVVQEADGRWIAQCVVDV